MVTWPRLSCDRVGGGGWVVALLSFAALCLTSAAFGQPQPRAEPHVLLLTFGPGDHPFSRFGHNAVAVVDPTTERGRVYNFGTFSFQSPTLISDFMQGRLRYWVSVTRLEETLASYRRQNRTIVAQRLALDHAEHRELLERLRTAALPENKYYRYDYYLDNCSTRVRDLLDQVFDGALARQAARPARLDWREHTSRLTQDSLGVYLGLNVVLAGKVDAPQTRWQEMFLPEVLRDELATLQHSGAPVVTEERVLFRAQRPAPSMKPPVREGWMLLCGVLSSSLLYLLARFGRRRRGLAVVWFSLVCLLGLLTGALGAVFWLFWLGTDHEIAHANENLLLFPVWMLVLPVAAGAMITGRSWGRSIFSWAATAALVSGLFGMILKLLPGFQQDNWMFAALLLPVWLTLVQIARNWGAIGPTPPGGGTLSTRV